MRKGCFGQVGKLRVWVVLPTGASLALDWKLWEALLMREGCFGQAEKLRVWVVLPTRASLAVDWKLKGALLMKEGCQKMPMWKVFARGLM